VALERNQKPATSEAFDNKPGAKRLCDQAGAQPAWRLNAIKQKAPHPAPRSRARRSAGARRLATKRERSPSGA